MVNRLILKETISKKSVKRLSDWLLKQQCVALCLWTNVIILYRWALQWLRHHYGICLVWSEGQILNKQTAFLSVWMMNKTLNMVDKITCVWEMRAWLNGYLRKSVHLHVWIWLHGCGPLPHLGNLWGLWSFPLKRKHHAGLPWSLRHRTY